MSVHPVPAAPLDPQTGLEPLGPPVTTSETYKQSDVSSSSGQHTVYDETALVRADTYTDHQYDQLRQVLSKRTTHGDPLDLEHNFSLEKYIREMLDRSQKQGVKSRKAGIIFRDVSTYGVGAGYTFLKTIYDPFTAPLRLREIFTSLRAPTKQIIHKFNGVVRDGEMLLVLGKPGSGCTTLLKTLAGQHNGFKRVEGEIHCDGIPLSIMSTQYKGEMVYNGELDNHFPHLNVSQTLEFAARTRAPTEKARIDQISRNEYVKNMRDVLATTFGLRHTYKTKVGNDYIRGVSGGERKRVSIAETLSSRAQIQMWDNSTRGLDASTALEYAKALRVSTNLAKTTCLVCIYQAGEQLYEVFDKVTVVYAGYQIYFGPTELAKQYFVDMGFECPSRQTTADFLTAITDPKARFAREGFANKVPRSPEEFAAYWQKSNDFQNMQRDMDTYDATYKNEETLRDFHDSVSQEKAKHTGKKSPYTISYPMQLRACVRRSYQRTFGDPAYLIANVFASIFQSLIVGSVFYDIPQDTSGYFSRGGVIFFAILFNALQSMSEVAALYAQRPIIAKHKSYALYHPSADALAQLVADIPIKLIVLTCFDIILYFMTHLSRTPSQFFIFYLFTFLTTMCMTSFFRMLASITKTVDQALTLAGIGVLALVIYTGYVIPTNQAGWWFRWISYINPIQYGFEALMVNEFHDYSQTPCAPGSITPSGATYNNPAYQVCAVTGSTPGSLFVSGPNYLSQSFEYTYSHIWRNLGIIIGFWIFFLAINALATEYIAPVAEGGDVVVFRRGHAPKAVVQSVKNGGAADLEKQDLAVPEGTPIAAEAAEEDGTMDVIEKSEDIFTWKKLKYVINIKGEKRTLLNDVQGYVKPGTLTALMGESGAGKTTLLNVLAQRVDTGVVTGDMLVNGAPLDHAFQRHTGYVQQQDVHMAESTVREALQFSAMLRQPKTVSRKEKYEYVEEVIKLLEMEDYAEAVVGEPGIGLNVEQRKRLTIGVELAAKPKLLLFLDEPTSGLDSQSAWSIVLFMRKLANAGQAILCTIHQPSAVLFEQFDRLLLLQKGGRTVYFGDIGKDSKIMTDYFERQGAGKCGKADNPAEYILDAIGAGATAHSDKDWFELWNDSEECRAVSQDLDKMHANMRQRRSDNQIKEKHSTSTYAMPFSTQLVYVMKRIFKKYQRNPTYIFAKTALNIIAGLFIGFTFYKSGQGVQAQQNKLFAMFMALVLSTSLMNQIQPQFVVVRNLFEVREKPSKMYSWLAFVLSAIIVEIPFNFVTGTLFFLPWYYATGFWQNVGLQGRSAGSVGIYEWLLLMTFEMWFSTFAQVCASFVPDEQTAAIVSTLLFTFVILFNGVLQPISLLVGFWHWLYHLTPFTYIIEGLTVNVIHGLPIICTNIELNSFAAPPGQTCEDYLAPYFEVGGFGTLQTGQGTSQCGYCRYRDGDQYLETLGMSYSHRWRDFGLIWGYILFNAFLTVVLFYIFRIWKFKFSRGTSKASGKTDQATNAVSKNVAAASGAAEIAAVAPRSDVRANVDAKGRQGGTSGP